MAGGFENQDDDVIASINMVPFIDISLVLLIIFMVTSSYIVKAAIEVKLPSAASGSNVTPSTIAIVLAEDGRLSLNGDLVSSVEALVPRIREEVARSSDVQAIIAADRGVDYGKVVDIIDVVKLNGVKSFALNIEREAEATP